MCGANMPGTGFGTGMMRTLVPMIQGLGAGHFSNPATANPKAPKARSSGTGVTLDTALTPPTKSAMQQTLGGSVLLGE